MTGPSSIGNLALGGAGSVLVVLTFMGNVVGEGNGASWGVGGIVGFWWDWKGG